LGPRIDYAIDGVHEVTRPIPEPAYHVVHHTSPGVVVNHVVDHYPAPIPEVTHVHHHHKNGVHTHSVVSGCHGPSCKFEQIVKSHHHFHEAHVHHHHHNTEEPDLETKVLAAAALDKLNKPNNELKEMATKALNKIETDEKVKAAAEAGAAAGYQKASSEMGGGGITDE
jgi:hypothetical protein